MTDVEPFLNIGMKTPCKQFYKLFAEKINTEPTAIKSWKNHCPEVADN